VRLPARQFEEFSFSEPARLHADRHPVEPLLRRNQEAAFAIGNGYEIDSVALAAAVRLIAGIKFKIYGGTKNGFALCIYDPSFKLIFRSEISAVQLFQRNFDRAVEGINLGNKSRFVVVADDEDAEPELWIKRLNFEIALLVGGGGFPAIRVTRWAERAGANSRAGGENEDRRSSWNSECSSSPLVSKPPYRWMNWTATVLFVKD
jgi:hypothetical protein